MRIAVTAAGVAACAVMLACGAAIGWTAHTPARPPPPAAPVPTNEQLAVATAALVNYLDFHPDLLVAQNPSFLSCVPAHRFGLRGLDCRYGVTYSDDTASIWTIMLSREGLPIWVGSTKPRGVPTA